VDTLRQQEAKAMKAWADLQQSLKYWRAAKADLVVARRELALARGRLNSGLGSRLQVVQAAALQAGIQDQQEEAVATYYQARVNLAHATGTLINWVPAGD
jgi:outer membrane protein TolC